MSHVLDAVRSNEVDVVRRIVAADPSLVNYRDDEGNSAVMAAINHGAHDAAALLVVQGARLNVYEASASGNAARVRATLDDNPGLLNAHSADGWTPLHLAAFFGHDETARALLDRGADLHALSTNRMENQPIHAAAANGQSRLVALLLDHGADVNAQSRGWSPLHLAVENGNEGLVHLLLLRCADTSAPMPGGQAPIARARQQGHDEIVALLDGAAR
ncbi:MAG: ankyrin repeat domain-containing protein [Chloroflexota bacterium]|nr:ankyrin repeat domain-containing protein [Chloroflexota bacterium]